MGKGVLGLKTTDNSDLLMEAEAQRRAVPEKEPGMQGTEVTSALVVWNGFVHSPTSCHCRAGGNPQVFWG